MTDEARAPPSERIKDYTLLYGTDKFGEETGAQARVWKVYLDETDNYDKEFIESHNNSMDALLIFAGLFATVVSGLLNITITSLIPDYGKGSFSLLSELVTVQRAMANGTSIGQNLDTTLVAVDLTEPTTLNISINALIVASLILSLVAALLAVVVKQWLTSYQSSLRGSPRDRANVHHFRLEGLRSWRVNGIIGAVPYLLHLALLLLLIGLTLFLHKVNKSLFKLAIVLTSVLYGFYVAMHLLPLRYPNCPYKTQLTDPLYHIGSLLGRFYDFIKSCLVNTLRRRPTGPVLDDNEEGLHLIVNDNTKRPKSYRELEIAAAEEQRDVILVKILVWLLSKASNQSVLPVVVHALSGMPALISEEATRELTSGEPSRIVPNICVHGQPYAPPLIAAILNNIWTDILDQRRSKRLYVPVLSELNDLVNDSNQNAPVLIRSLFWVRAQLASIHDNRQQFVDALDKLDFLGCEFDVSVGVGGLETCSAIELFGADAGHVGLILLPLLISHRESTSNNGTDRLIWRFFHTVLVNRIARNEKMHLAVWVNLFRMLVEMQTRLKSRNSVVNYPTLHALLYLQCAPSRGTHNPNSRSSLALSTWDEAPISLREACGYSAELKGLISRYMLKDLESSDEIQPRDRQRRDNIWGYILELLYSHLRRRCNPHLSFLLDWKPGNLNQAQASSSLADFDILLLLVAFHDRSFGASDREWCIEEFSLLPEAFVPVDTEWVTLVSVAIKNLSELPLTLEQRKILADKLITFIEWQAKLKVNCSEEGAYTEKQTSSSIVIALGNIFGEWQFDSFNKGSLVKLLNLASVHWLVCGGHTDTEYYRCCFPDFFMWIIRPDTNDSPGVLRYLFGKENISLTQSIATFDLNRAFKTIYKDNAYLSEPGNGPKFHLLEKVFSLDSQMMDCMLLEAYSEDKSLQQYILDEMVSHMKSVVQSDAVNKKDVMNLKDAFRKSCQALRLSDETVNNKLELCMGDKVYQDLVHDQDAEINVRLRLGLSRLF